ncbi:MAG TPA: mandelate racemase/muconate lactonizing enzyme family protein [Sphingomonadaceae bacterium]|nr:mandelate racemase/muconate lactonizing enzyme family protein [Sphingomonadaceae bacterium]
MNRVRRHLLMAMAGGAVIPGAAGGVARATTPAVPPASGGRPQPIRRITATPLAAVFDYPYGNIGLRGGQRCCYVEVETAGGLVGHGISGLADPRSIADIVNHSAAPRIVGDDALCNEAVWSKLYWHLTPRGQSGLAVHAMSAIDIALWDIRGKALGVPIATLIGGARREVPVYVTFGPAELSRQQLVDSARDLARRGVKHLKMVVASGAWRQRDRTPIGDMLAEDVARVAAVRAAIGDGVDLSVDANCNLDFASARWLIDALKPYRLSFFEEPLLQNDVPLMAALRRATGMTITAGQNEGRAVRFRDMLAAGAVDAIQPNVMIGGGYTQVLKIAGFAEAYDVPILNGGAGALQNMHLHAGLAHGGMCEWHVPFMELCGQLYRDMPRPADNRLAIPERPGLGFEPNPDAIAELAARAAGETNDKT